MSIYKNNLTTQFNVLSYFLVFFHVLFFFFFKVESRCWTELNKFQNDDGRESKVPYKSCSNTLTHTFSEGQRVFPKILIIQENIYSSWALHLDLKQLEIAIISEESLLWGNIWKRKWSATSKDKAKPLRGGTSY